jgi:uncharacterized protein (DUF58 family)
MVELEGSGPLGLVPWSRRQPLALAGAMEVGPAPSPVTMEDPPDAGIGAGDAWARSGPGDDTLRGVRPYAPGDPIRVVHWPATARWGDLMVKELDVPVAAAVVIVVDLRGDHDASEAAASVAAGLAGAALRAGYVVSMLTAERDGPRAGSVTSSLEAGRRLARAVADAAPVEPSPDGAAVLRVTAR